MAILLRLGPFCLALGRDDDDDDDGDDGGGVGGSGGVRMLTNLSNY